MQDIHAIGGGAGRLFTAGGGGGGGGGDRRMRPHNHQNHQPLKCPRCDSLNTKFCYYNNYNLSQPRHFCKSCRRYWTKGGVLRNVPIGGGCRKSKRSKPKPSASGSGSVSGSGSTTADVVQREQKSNSHSSSESSSLTATTTTATAKTTAGAISEEVSATNSNLLNFADSSRFFISQNATTNPSFDHQPLIDDHASNGQIFSDIGSFTDMMTSSTEPALLGFNAVDMSAYRLQQNEQHAPVVQNQSSNEQWQNEQQQQKKMVGTTTNDELKMHEINATGYLDQIDLTALQQSRGSNGGLAALDWQNPRAGGNCGSGEQGMFDFTGAVDQAYWCQTQWHDHDQSLNFLP